MTKPWGKTDNRTFLNRKDKSIYTKVLGKWNSLVMYANSIYTYKTKALHQGSAEMEDSNYFEICGGRCKNKLGKQKIGGLEAQIAYKFWRVGTIQGWSLLECFLNLDREAINYETKSLHYSAPMFSENQ